MRRFRTRMKKKINIQATGCCLLDRIITHFDFNSKDFIPLRSRKKGDGGLEVENLVFLQDLMDFCGLSREEIFSRIIAKPEQEIRRLGGPAIIALARAALLLDDKAECCFWGGWADDENGKSILKQLKKQAINIDHYQKQKGQSPLSLVLSGKDPVHGDVRSFLCDLGLLLQYSPDNLGPDFFAGDIHFYGATALTPLVHQKLDKLLAKSKTAGKVTIVTTVYDFINEKQNPEKKWPLGASDSAYSDIDLLITDLEEALRLSGTSSIEQALDFFINKGTASCVITQGSRPFYYFSNGSLFKKSGPARLPVCAEVETYKEKNPGLVLETTGCGDNFAGGLITSLASQLMENSKGQLDLVQAAEWAAVSGALACFHPGGLDLQQSPTRQRQMFGNWLKAYQKQIRSN